MRVTSILTMAGLLALPALHPATAMGSLCVIEVDPQTRQCLTATPGGQCLCIGPTATTPQPAHDRRGEGGKGTPGHDGGGEQGGGDGGGDGGDHDGDHGGGGHDGEGHGEPDHDGRDGK
jgi:hypothetical protein